MLEKLMTTSARKWHHFEEDHPSSRRFGRWALGVFAGVAAAGRPLVLDAFDPCSPSGQMCESNTCCPDGYSSTTEWCPGGTGCWDSGSGESCCDCMQDGYEDLEHLCWCSEGELE
jgi:hypothetical protein